jgi:pantoate--beta-alanine ligase
MLPQTASPVEFEVQIIRSIKQMQAWSRRQHRLGKTIGFVPTMGALHEGHLSLIRAANKRADVTVVSIFVNPTQFSPSEDFDQYPRPFRRDCAMCRAENVDVVFAPTVKEMYPGGYHPAAARKSEIRNPKSENGGAGIPPADSFSTYVDELALSQNLEGASRPNFFRGVCTVVAKLFNCVQPDYAFFGQKDAQQCAVIKRMVRDLNFPLKIVVCPIVREPDGLAMSSRNVYLSSGERRDALALKRALDWATQQVARGERNTSALQAGMQQILCQSRRLRIDYIAIVQRDTFLPLRVVQKQKTLIALAAFVGKTRLIDNQQI